MEEYKIGDIIRFKTPVPKCLEKGFFYTSDEQMQKLAGRCFKISSITPLHNFNSEEAARCCGLSKGWCFLFEQVEPDLDSDVCVTAEIAAEFNKIMFL